MNELKNDIKKYLLVKYAKNRLMESTNQISKAIPWIQRKNFLDTIDTHCRTILNSLINENEQQSLRRNKYIIDTILKYIINRSESILKISRKTNDIKTYMQLNSYIVYDEIQKGLEANKSRRAIKFNIEKQLSDIQERMDSKVSIEEILQEKISA